MPSGHIRHIGPLLFSLALAATAEPAWPCFRGPDRNGISTETGWSAEWPANGPKVLWRAKVGTGYATVSVAGGRAYTAGNTESRDTVFCFDAETGAVVWTHAYDCPLKPNNHAGGPGATPTVDGDRLYTLSKIGQLFCLDAAGGKVVWSKPLAQNPGVKPPTWGFQGSPIADEDRLYVNVGSAGLCLDKATGKVLWSSEPEGAGYSTPVLRRTGNRTALVLMTKKKVVAVDAADGKPIWSYDWPTSYGENIADPVWIGDRLLISASHRMGAALLDVSGESPTPVWKAKRHGTHTSTSILWKDHVYGFDGFMRPRQGRKALNCLDARTGEIVWREEDLFGTLLLADGKLVILTVDGHLVVAAASPSGYRETARAKVLDGRSWTMPTLAGGRIYCRSDAGEIVCVDARSR